MNSSQFVLPTQDKADVDFLLKQIDRLGDAHAVAGRKLRSLRREVARQAAANPALRPQDSVNKLVYVSMFDKFLGWFASFIQFSGSRPARWRRGCPPWPSSGPPQSLCSTS